MRDDTMSNTDHFPQCSARDPPRSASESRKDCSLLHMTSLTPGEPIRQTP